MANANNKKRFHLSDFSKYMCLISIVLVFGVFSVIIPNFMTPYSLQNMMTEAAPLLLMAGGMSFIIYTGGIDLGAGAMVSCTCVLSGVYVAQFGNAIIPIMLIAGLVMGLVNGLLVTKLKLPSFIVTLCTMNFWSYIALYLCPNGSEIIPMDKRFMVQWATQKVLGIPVMFLIALVGVAVLYIFQQYTVYGKAIFGVGANVSATRLAGVNTDMAQIAAFVISGACSALAGALYAYKLKSAVPTVGDALTLTAIASVALGGTSMAGGRGSVLRTALGVVTITGVTSGLNMMGVDPLWKDIIIGIILIIAVCLNTDTRGRDLIVK